MPIKQIQLSGISRRPDDSASDNGSLMHCVNLCNDGAGLHLLEKPTLVFQLQDKEQCIFIHETPNYKHYIIQVSNALYWCEESDDYARHLICEIEGLRSLEALGNTIVALAGSGVKYILYSNSDVKYKMLGARPEMTEIQFALSSEFKYYPEQGEAEYYSKEEIYDNRYSPHMIPLMGDDVFDNSGRIKTLSQMVAEGSGWLGYDLDLKDKTYSHKPENGVQVEISEQFKDGISNALLGSVNKIIAEATKRNKFVMPFFVRYAYEMFDGALITHSYPVLLIPNSKAPVFAIRRDYFDVIGKSSGNVDMKYTIFVSGNAFCYVSDLEMNILSIPDTLKDWSDLIKGVSIYATPPIYTYDQSGRVCGWRNMEDVYNNLERWNDYYTVGKIKDRAQYGKNMMLDSFKDMYASFNPRQDGEDRTKDEFPCWVLDVPMKNIEDIRDDLHSAGQFYKIAEFSVDELMEIKAGKHKTYQIGVCKSLEMKENTIANIKVKPQMQDDYHSQDNVIANGAYAYNNRVNLFGVSRKLHSPINPAIQLPIRNNASIGYNCSIAISIHNSSGNDTVVSSSASPTIKTKDLLPDYIFYPNRNAYKAVIRWRGEKYEMKLTEHPSLEGAYWCTPLWSSDDDGTEGIVTDFPKATNAITEELGKVYSSAVDNPLYFAPENINQIGDGVVRALCANTQSVNAYNFGLATMYAFTSKGVWGLKVSDTGGFQSVQPVTRDVIIDGTMPLQLDQSIIFLAERGVLRFDINSSQAKPMSVQLDGITEASLAKIGDIVQATTDNYEKILRVINETNMKFWRNEKTKMVYDYRHGRVYFCNENSTWVYSLASGAWSEATTNITSPLNAWPLCEFVSDDKVMKLEDDTRYSEGVFITRPLKTGGESFAKVSELVLRGNFKASSNQIQTALFASRDWRNYKLISTSSTARNSRYHGDGYRSHIVAGIITAKDGCEVPPEALSADYLAIDITQKETNKPR